MSLGPEQIQRALLSLIAFVVAVSLHEFGHAVVADHLGDRLPRAQGRVTLSPLAHIDLLGTIILPLAAALMPGGFPLIAWGKPVQTNPRHYTRMSPKLGHLVVSLAGPLMNLGLAFLVSVVFLALGRSGHLSPTAAAILIRYFLSLNIVLLFFNLIPVPPLDGAAVLAGFLPGALDFIPRTLQRYGMLLFFVLFLSGALGIVMRPVYHLIEIWADALRGAVAR